MNKKEAIEIIKSIETLDDIELQQAIETVLNLLKEKDKEIERLKREKENTYAITRH